MKCFDKLQTILWIMVLFVCVLVAVQYDNAFANTELFVNLKDGKTIYKNQAITTELFEFRLGNKTICDVENIEITPKVFVDAGEQMATFTYKEGNAAYMKKLVVSVNSIAPAFLSGKQDTVCLIEGQNVTKEQLPEIYLYYNNGEQEQIMDYSFQVDWDKKQVCISYEHLQFYLKIDVIENRMDYLEVESTLKSVPENYVFHEKDIIVTLHYTNGTKENVTDYQILPYKLVEGCESLIYVSYKEMKGQFKVMAIKQTIEEMPLPTEQPEYLAPDLTLPEPQYTPTVEEAATFSPEPDQTNMPGAVKNQNPEYTTDLEEIKTPASQPVKEEQSELEKKDSTPPKTNVQNKTYKKDIKISVTDESEIVSIILKGSINKTIGNGYKLTKEGSYQLIMTDIYGNTKTVKFKLEKPVKKIKILYSFTNEWDEIKFSAKVTGTKRDVKWSVSDKKIATVDKNGNFKAKKSGTVYVVAKLDKKKRKQKIKIEKKKKSILLY